MKLAENIEYSPGPLTGQEARRDGQKEAVREQLILGMNSDFLTIKCLVSDLRGSC